MILFPRRREENHNNSKTGFSLTILSNPAKIMTFSTSIIILIVFNSINAQNKQYPLSKSLAKPEDCQEYQFFDTVALECQNCSFYEDVFTKFTATVTGIDRITNETIDRSQRHDQRRTTCECEPGFYRSWKTSGILHCLPCPNGSITSRNGLYCSKCPKVTVDSAKESNETSPVVLRWPGNMSNPRRQQIQNPPVESRTSCFNQCPPNQIAIERPLDQSTHPLLYMLVCQPCQSGEQAIGDKCLPCHHSFSDCQCQSDHGTIHGGICLPNYRLLPEKARLYTINFDTDDEVQSAFLSTHLQAAVYQCRYHTNVTACQILANMCVLLNYELYDGTVAGVSNACTQLATIGRQQTTPALLYGDSGDSELTKVMLRRYSIGSQLKFFAMRLDARGQLRKFDDLEIIELILCPGTPMELSAGIFFGNNFHVQCSLSAKFLWNTAVRNEHLYESGNSRSDILNGESATFYDLYLVDGDDLSQRLYPIPILVTNLQYNNQPVNQQPEIDRWQLVRRFFLAEKLASIESLNSPTMTTEPRSSVNATQQPQSKYLRYASDIKLVIRLSSRDHGLIHTPLLKVTYKQISRDDLNQDQIVPLSFDIIYTMDHTYSSHVFTTLLTILICLSLLIGLARTWVYSRRHTAVDLSALAHLICFAANKISISLFLLAVVFAVHAFTLAKGQAVIHGLLPDISQEAPLFTAIYIAFGLRTIGLVYDLIVRIRAEIFFIDWEQPKVIHPQPTAISSTLSQPETPLDQPSPSNRLPPLSSAVTHQPMTVSIWRTNLVANEWLRLSVYRRLGIATHLMGLLALLLVIGMSNTTTADSSFNIVQDQQQRFIPESRTCRLAVINICYIICVIIQISIRRVSEKIVTGDIIGFVDLCSVANVSLFTMLHKRYGFYVHGRSTHGRADVSMREMNEQLKREEDDLCSKRGLLPNTDQQTFEIILPVSIGEQISRMRAIANGSGVNRAAGKNDNDWEGVCKAYGFINKFLAGFIDHAFKDADYVVKEKSNVELILDFEKDQPVDRGFFYSDNGHSFERLILSGMELKLITFELILFTTIDTIFTSYILSAVVTYVASIMINKLFKAAWRRTLINRALIDERFLI